MAMLLYRPSLVPDGDDEQVVDWLDKSSGSHARVISGSLKNVLRAAVELLGNEYVRHASEVDSTALTVECLRYMYRLLFLLTMEAQQQVRCLPMKAKSYKEGFALPRLRELMPLYADSAAEGVVVHESLMQLFEQVYVGRYESDGQGTIQDGLDTFSIVPPKCDLFDPDATPLLSSIQIRNKTWQTIIHSLSLGDNDKGVGRNSYPQLTINHLGEVFNALLSYVGFVAREDLYEVKPASKAHDLLGPAHFVNREALEKHYQEDEVVCDKEGKAVCHPKGRFIYRLSGRTRESYASYNALESPTQCVDALKKVIEGKSADELLQITIFDPAMGSGALLNEVVSRLAEVYMNRATQELGELLSPEDYAQHLQRVKLYLAGTNVYGVDFHPMLVEMGGVSLWLNTRVAGGFVPWFGNRLTVGNASVGAWRRVYEPAALKQGKWWESPPQDVTQARGAIYHCLLGDAGMVGYKGKVIAQLAKEELRHITVWRKSFTRPLSGDDIKRLRLLSNRIDELWDKHEQDLKRLKSLTTDPIPFYPSELSTKRAIGSYADKDATLNLILNPPGGFNASNYQRLKLVMDYWCALWFWPIRKAQLLPMRNEFISDIALILAGREDAGTADIFSTVSRDEHGYMDVTKLIAELPRLQLVQQLAHRERFHHWPLVFADQFADHAGFDVVMRNPPKLKRKFVEKAVMGDLDPRFAVRKLTVSQTARMRTDWIQDEDHRHHYMRHYESTVGQYNFLKAVQNYPLHKGMQSNVYKSGSAPVPVG